jgi:iron complex transport system ATP-binding protein
VLAGELTPLAGDVTLGGRRVHGAPLEWLAARRAVMTQASAVVFDFAVDEILRMGWTPNLGLGEAAREAAQARVVEWCALTPLLGRRFNTLSGGEQQRVQFARVLMQAWPAIDGAPGEAEPRFLMLDEPVASLDLAHERLLMGTVARLTREAAIGAVVVLHDLNLAVRFADRVVLLADGRVQSQGPPDQVLAPTLLSRVYDVKVRVGRLEGDGRLVVTT